MLMDCMHVLIHKFVLIHDDLCCLTYKRSMNVSSSKEKRGSMDVMDPLAYPCLSNMSIFMKDFYKHNIHKCLVLLYIVPLHLKPTFHVLENVRCFFDKVNTFINI